MSHKTEVIFKKNMINDILQLLSCDLHYELNLI